MAELDIAEDTPESKLYYRELMNKYTLLSKTNLTEKDFMTKQWVYIMIQRIIAAEQIVLNSGYSTLHESVKTTLCTYMVEETEDGKKTLVLKPVPGKEHRSKTIIPLEHTYNVVRKAHLATKHGSCKDMEAWLANNNYTLNNMCCSIFIKCCEDCSCGNQDIIKPVSPIPENVARNIIPKFIYEDSFEHVCSVEVLDMSNNPDQFYHCLFVYEDRKTNFIQLRPMNTNAETEMSVELLKIIMDFGPPECLVVSFENIKIFQKILKLLETLTKCKIILAFNKKGNKLVQQVTQNIVKWMKEHDCRNWGTGCHEVQWNMNNEPGLDGMTPYSRVFGNQYEGSEYQSKFMPGNDNSDDDEYVNNFNLDDDKDVNKKTEKPSVKSSTEIKKPDQDSLPDTQVKSVEGSKADENLILSKLPFFYYL